MPTTEITGPVTKLLYSPDEGWSAGFPPWDSPATLLFVFGGPDYVDHPEPIRELARAFPRSVIVGSSSAGEIHGQRVGDNTLSVGIIRFAHTRLSTALAPVRDSGDSAFAGESLALQLQTPDLRACMVFCDGLNVNGSALARGLNGILGPRVLVSGGLAGDGSAFKRTWVLRRDRLVPGVAVAVGLSGSRLQLGHGSRGGWSGFGPVRRVTKSAGSVLHELDGAAALPLYKQYLGERANGLPATALLFPLELRVNPGADPVVRTVLAVSEAEGSMTYAGEVPEGAFVRFMHSDAERLITAAGESAGASVRGMGASAGLAVAVSCVGRRLVLGERVEEEVDAVAAALGGGDQLVGFYSYGELSPRATGACELHNQTMTITTIREV